MRTKERTKSITVAMRGAILLALLLAATGSAAAGGRGVGFHGWGPRVGVSSNPDQIAGGVQFDLGDFAERVRWQPSVEIGFGDDVTTVAGNFMVAYRFRIDSELTPYAGGELSVVFYDFDDHGSETEIGPAAVGGFDLPLSGGTTFLLELQVGFGDTPDAKLMAGWTF